MDFSKINLFKALTRKMGWLVERQSVLARNIANADTPGYKTHDIKKADFRDILGPTAGTGTIVPVSHGLAVTHPGHIGGPTARVAAEFQVRDRNAPGRLSGNDVVVESELAKVGQTAMDYELTTNLYRRHVAMIRMALGRNGG